MHTVRVEVKHFHPRRLVHVKQHEGGTADAVPIPAQPANQPDGLRLTRAEIAIQSDAFAAAKGVREIGCNRFGLFDSREDRGSKLVFPALWLQLGERSVGAQLNAFTRDDFTDANRVWVLALR